MTRGDFKTIIAPKPTVSKIERYKIERALPSNSQALADMVTEFEGNADFVKLLNKILIQIKEKIKDLRNETASKYKKTVEALMELLTTIIEAIVKTQRSNML